MIFNDHEKVMYRKNGTGEQQEAKILGKAFDGQGLVKLYFLEVKQNNGTQKIITAHENELTKKSKKENN